MEELSVAANLALPTQQRVTAQVVHRLYSYTSERLDDPYMGLRMGQQLLLSDIAPVMNVVLYSADGWQMLRCLQRFWPLLSEIERLELHIEKDSYCIRLIQASEELAHPLLTDTVVSGFLRLAAVLLSIDQSPGIGITLRRSCPGDPGAFSRLAGAPVTFDHAHDQLIFSSSVLDKQNPASDTVRLQQALKEAQQQLSILRAGLFQKRFRRRYDACFSWAPLIRSVSPRH